MPDFYPKGEYDLAGFAVGLVDKRDIIDGSKIFPGDVVLGLPSTGLHSNGYSLARKIFKGKTLKTWGKKLLAPTKIYVEDVARLIRGLKKENQIVLGMAHITGGGLPGNVVRILPKRVRAVIRRDAWRVPKIFTEMQKKGRVPEADMWRTFNMGIGLVFVVRPDSLALAQKILPEAKIIGGISAGNREVVLK